MLARSLCLRTLQDVYCTPGCRSDRAGIKSSSVSDHTELGVVPVRGELHLGRLRLHQLGNEGQVGDLGRSPAKLENDDEGGEVEKAGPLWSVLAAAYTLVKNERERDHNADCTCKKQTKQTG